MTIANRKEADDVIALVRTIEPLGRSGIEFSVLVLRVAIAPTRVERLLQKHTDYFVRVGGGQKFALNRFGQFDGSAERISADVERSYKQTARRRNIVLTLITAIAAMLSFINFLYSD